MYACWWHCLGLNLLSFNHLVTVTYYIEIRSTWRWRYDFFLLYIHLTLTQNSILFTPTPPSIFFLLLLGKTHGGLRDRGLPSGAHTIHPRTNTGYLSCISFLTVCIFLVHKQRSITPLKLLTLHINEILAKVSFRFLFYNILNPVKSCRHWYPQHKAWFHSFTVSYRQSDIFYSRSATLLYVKRQEKKNCVQSTARVVAPFLILSKLMKEALCLTSWFIFFHFTFG